MLVKTGPSAGRCISFWQLQGVAEDSEGCIREVNALHFLETVHSPTD